MEFRYTYTRLNVKDFSACRQFYVDIMGLNVVFEDEKEQYVELDGGGVKITLFPRDKLGEFMHSEEYKGDDVDSPAVVLTFCVSNLEKALKHFEEKGYSAQGKTTQYADRGFKSNYVRDPDGNIVEIEEMIDVVL